MTNYDPEDGLSRRQLLRRSAVVGGTLLWTVPVVQTIPSTALATEGSPGGVAGAISYVFVFFQCPDGHYIVKYESGGSGYTADCSAGRGNVSADDPGCLRLYDGEADNVSGPRLSGCPPLLSAGTNSSGQLVITLDPDEDCTIVGWLLHDGTCKNDPPPGVKPSMFCRSSAEPLSWDGVAVGPAVPTNDGGSFIWTKCGGDPPKDTV